MDEEKNWLGRQRARDVLHERLSAIGYSGSVSSLIPHSRVLDVILDLLAEHGCGE